MIKEKITPLRSSYGVNDYGYINARIRAMRGSLLGKPELERLLQAESLEVLNSILSGTAYGQDIKASEQKLAKGMRRLSVMEDGFKQNFVRTMSKICAFIDGTPAELANIILGRWDIYNLKTIIRGKFVDRSPVEIIQDLFFVGSLKREYLEKLAHMKDMNEVFNAVTYSHLQLMLPSKAEFDSYVGSRDLMGMELILDKKFYKNALEWCDHMGEDHRRTRRLLQTEIDAINIMTCLKLSIVDIDPEEALKFFIPDGIKVKRRDFPGLVAMGDVEKVLSWLEKVLVMKDGMSERIEVFRKLGDISIFERFFRTNILTEVQSQALSDPLGSSVLMSYLKLKYNELINLRLIARYVEFGLPPDIVKLEMIFV